MCSRRLGHNETSSSSATGAPSAFSAVRGRLLGRKIVVGRARDATEALAEASIELLPTAPLLPRIWQLRGSFSAYDAAYVAAAEAHNCTLLTSDRRPAQAPGVRCAVRLALHA